MDENSAADLENIIASVYTITNDPFFCSLGFKPQRLSKRLKRQPSDDLSRNFHNIPMDAALHCIIVTLIVFIILHLLCKLVLYILM